MPKVVLHFAGNDAGRLDLRYVTERKNRSNGKVRRYWQRKHHKLARLPDGPDWVVIATELNRDADAKETPSAIVPETIAWAIRAYRDTDEYKDASDSTKSVYERWLKRYEAMWGAMRCRGITRRVIVDFLDGDDFKRPVAVIDSKTGQQKATTEFKRPTRVLAAAVLRNILNVAYNKGAIDSNPCTKLGLSRNKPRQALWEPEDLAAFAIEALAANDDGTPKYPEGEAAVRYNMLLLYTGQRPIDVQSMKREHRKNEFIQIRQQKTGKLVWIPEHRILKAELDKPSDRLLRHLVAKADGAPILYSALDKLCRSIRRACGLGHLQQRDLRRTAVVRLAEAGCTIPEIAAITGHSIEDTTKILETYLPRTLKMAQTAISKWEGKAV